MSYATSDKQIEALKDERRQLISAKQAIERRIDELCQENERLRADQAHWELGNCPSCPNVVSLHEALEQNTKLREYAKLMHDHIKECCDCCDEWYCSNWDEDNECCRFDTMMRVCGIEVPS